MNAFRKQVEDYLKLWPNNPAIASYDFSKDEIHYGTRRDNRSISKLPGDEEYVRAYIVTKLVNELGYSMEDIAFEKGYSIGRPTKKNARIDIIVYKPHSNDVFMFIELKAPDKYKEEKAKAIEHQLYALAAQEINSESNSIDYLVYCSLNDLDCSENVTLIDYKKFDTYNKWKNSPDYHSKLLSGYNSAPSSTAKREFGVNDVDSRIEGIISSLNQHIKYTEVKDSLLFVNTCILALFNDEFRKNVVDGMYDNDSIVSVIDEMQTIIVRSGGEIDKYSFTNTTNKASITSLIKQTCTSMKSKKELNSAIYSLLDFLKDLTNKVFPIISYGSNEDKLLISETIYKYIYIHKNGKNSIISTPANITNFMVKLLDLKENDFFVEFCSGFGNFTLSYLLHIINNYNDVNGNKVSGIESEDYIYLFYITTLRIIGLNLIQALNGDMLRLSNINDLIPSYNNNYKVGACMNPPFGGKDNVIAAKLVLKGCEILPKGSLFAVILPYVFAIGNSKSNGFDASQFHKDLLKNNTLLASFSLADGTFGVAASTVVTTFIIKTGIPHFKTDEKGDFVIDFEGKKIPNEKTFLMYCKDDGFKILKNTRVEKKKGLGKEKVQSWLNDYQAKTINPLKSLYMDIHEDDEWLIEAYMKTDYSTLTEKDFEKTIRDFYAYKIKHGGTSND